MFLVTFQVIIGPIGNPPQFTPAKREQIFNIAGAFGIEGQLFRRMFPKPQVLRC